MTGIAIDSQANRATCRVLVVGPAELARRTELYYTRIDFGSHVLFEPELALGVDLNERLAVEASYTHLSTGQIFAQGKNQGLDDAGVRLVWKFGGK